MLTIYLDKNVLSHLKSNPDGPFAKKVNDLKPFAVFPYSRAILSDLCKGYKTLDEEKRKKVSEDLELISELSKCLYLDWSVKDKLVNWFVDDIKTQFESELEVYNTKSSDYMSFLDETAGSENEIDNLLRNFGQILNTIPIKIDFSELRKTEQGSTFADLFPNSEKSGMLSDFIKDFTKWVDEINEDPSSYKALRKTITDHTGIQNKSSEINTNVLEALDKMLINSTGKSLNELTEATYTNKEMTLEDEFRNEFVTLDLVGYKSDQLKKGYTNFLNDGQHAFIGAHCDFFITDDKRTLEKANALYGKRRLSSKACTINEFLEIAYSFNYGTNQSDFLEKAVSINGLTPQITKEENGVALDIYYIYPKFLNYYNQLDVLKEKDGKISFSYRRNSENYLRVPPFIEIENLVNYLHSFLGTDFRDRSKYIPEIENEKVYGCNWSGRKWILEEYEVFINVMENDSFPQLFIITK